MPWCSVLTRPFPLIAAALGLAVGGLVPGCGPAETPTSQTEVPETKAGVVKAGVVNPSKLAPTKRLPKNVNPNASNKGIKGKYAD